MDYLSIANIDALAELFKVLSDPNRLRTIQALQACELCVGDLSTTLGMKQSAVSHQLAILRHAKLVKTRRDGQYVFYSLDDEHVSQIVGIAALHLAEIGKQ